VLPNLRSISFLMGLCDTDKLLCFLAGTHLPNLEEVEGQGLRLRPNSSNPWWKQALVKAAAGNLRKCSTVELDLLDMSEEANEEAAVAFLSNWAVEESLVGSWELRLSYMLTCPLPVLSSLPQGLLYLTLR
jgi:hypothetical protein